MPHVGRPRRRLHAAPAHPDGVHKDPAFESANVRSRHRLGWRWCACFHSPNVIDGGLLCFVTGARRWPSLHGGRRRLHGGFLRVVGIRRDARRSGLGRRMDARCGDGACCGRHGDGAGGWAAWAVVTSWRLCWTRRCCRVMWWGAGRIESLMDRGGSTAGD
jgi:hypothetical protein